MHSRLSLIALSVALLAGCAESPIQRAGPAQEGVPAQTSAGEGRGTPPADVPRRAAPARPGQASPNVTATEPAPEPATGTRLGDAAVKVAVCGAVALGGVALAKKLVDWETRTGKLSAKDREAKQRGYMVGFALLGCSIGVNVASKVLSNLSESARKAQNDAWRSAQQGTSKEVAWSAPDARGTTQLTDVKVAADGKTCGIRRDVIRSNQGEERAHIPVCKASGERDYTPTVALG